MLGKITTNMISLQHLLWFYGVLRYLSLIATTSDQIYTYACHETHGPISFIDPNLIL